MTTYNPPRYIPTLQDRLADIYWAAPELWAGALFLAIGVVEIAVFAQFI
ncbi:hypothetical protein V5G24_10065 [Xanthobacter sp. VTT E-85241]